MKRFTRDEMAARVARDIPEGAYVNLGIGLPTMVANHLPKEREIVLQSENGLLGMGPAPAAGSEDPDLINAGIAVAYAGHRLGVPVVVVVPETTTPRARALIKAEEGDRWGNLVYRKTARNFGPIMATAAKCAIAQVRKIVALGALDPEVIVTPGIFVQRVVEIDVADQFSSPEAAA